MSLRAIGAMHLGETTRGALSDALVKYLPNGDRITLSNEVYLDSDGIAWEARGIAPHVAGPNLLTDDPLASHLALVRTAAAHWNGSSHGTIAPVGTPSANRPMRTPIHERIRSES